jgi:hypothetical protein
MLPSGGGHYAEYDAVFYGNQISEVPPGAGSTAGPNGNSFVGIIAPGETAPEQTVGPAAKVRVTFTGALYTTTIVVKDSNGDYFATYAPEAMAYGQEQYHADAHAARDAGTMIQMGDANGYNSDGNSTPKGQAIGIAIAQDGGGPYNVVGRTFEYNMAFPEGSYSVQLHAGVATANSSYLSILDANGNVLAQAQSDAGGFDTAYHAITVGTPTPAEYSWDHQGQLSNIVKFSRGVDTLGNPSYAYAKKEDDNTCTIYLTTDISDFGQFSSNIAGATGITGSPVCMEYGSGKLFMGTSTGNAYEIGFDGNTITSVLELHAMAGGESVREAKYDSIQNQWIFEAGEKIFTVVPGTTTAVERYALPAGAKCVDIAAGDTGVAIIIKKADHSLAPIIATAGWTEISNEAGMVASLNTLGVADFNYNYAMDKWVAASASGQVLLADDLLEFLGG